jgi:hypothetical protein
MPISVAFWNINMGAASFKNRGATFIAWCAKVKPDLLLLEEVSASLRNDMEKLTSMSAMNYVNTLDKNDDESTKQLWALQKIGNPYQARVLRLPQLDAKRALLKVTGTDDKGFALWVVHANASAKGGKAAVAATTDYLQQTPEAVVGGDFNCPIADAAGACHPLSWNNNPLLLTQWNKVDGTTTAPAVGLHLVTAASPLFYQKIEPHNVIDYVMPGAGRTATAVQNCPDEGMWRDILISFDHCPVVYTVT